MAIFSSLEFNRMEDLLLNQIQDLYDAESRITKALPKMIDAATEPELKKAFSHHLQETNQQVSRLQQVFRLLNVEPKGITCDAMKGLLSEGQEVVDAKGDPAVKDAALIAAAQRVEHYEISGYGSARAFAQHLGLNNIAQLLEDTLAEEKLADVKLTKIAESMVNVMAVRS